MEGHQFPERLQKPTRTVPGDYLRIWSTAEVAKLLQISLEYSVWPWSAQHNFIIPLCPQHLHPNCPTTNTNSSPHFSGSLQN